MTDTTLRYTPGSLVRAILMVAAAVAVFAVAARATTTLWWFVQAAVFAALAAPVVHRLRRHMPTAVAVLGLTALVALVFAGAVAAGLGELRDESAAFRAAIPDAVDEIEQAKGIGEIAKRLDLRRVLESFGDASADRFHLTGSDPVGLASRLGGGVSATFVVWILTVMLVFSGPGMVTSAIGTLPELHRARASEIVSAAYGRAVRYVGSSSVRAAALGLLTYAAARLLGLDMPGLLAMIAALFGFVPFVGVLSAGLLTASVAVLVGPVQAAAVVLAALVLQTLDSLVAQPRIAALSVDVGLFPTLVAAMIGFSLRGPGGLLVAVVVVTMLFSAIGAASGLRDEPEPPADDRASGAAGATAGLTAD